MQRSLPYYLCIFKTAGHIEFLLYFVLEKSWFSWFRAYFLCVTRKCFWFEFGFCRRMISLSSSRSSVKIMQESKSLPEGASSCYSVPKNNDMKQIHRLLIKAELPCVWFLAFISLYQKYSHWIFYIAGGEKGVCIEEDGRWGWIPALMDGTGDVTIHVVVPRFLCCGLHSPENWWGHTASVAKPMAEFWLLGKLINCKSQVT